MLYGQNPPGGLVNLISKTPQKTNFTDLITGGGGAKTILFLRRVLPDRAFDAAVRLAVRQGAKSAA